jgi:hypothetical protein
MADPVTDPAAPTVYELIRVQALVAQHQGETLARIESTVNGLVTQEQRTYDNQAATARHDDLVQQLARKDARSEATRRLAWTSIIAPLVIAFVLWASPVLTSSAA